jgi:alpha-mannosidase
LDALPEISGDLNPEFTATFSQRMCLKLRNRQVENQLLCAEQWAALCGLQDARFALQDAWWAMGFVHFHDTFTGSHPTRVMKEVLAALDNVEQVCVDAMASVMAQEEVSSLGVPAYCVFNPSPFARRECLHFVHQSQEYIFNAQVDAGGVRLFSMDDAQPAVAPSLHEAEAVCLKNEFLSIALTKQGVTSLRSGRGAELLGKTNGLLVVQQDEGSFQIESPVGAEIRPDPHTQRLTTDGVGIAELSGAFPGLPWMAGKSALDYRLRLTLEPDDTAVRLDVFLHWQGESSRVRLRLDTDVDAAAAVFEVPFGTQKRGAYGLRATAKGEWPAQRFVALEDGSKGLALVNRGVAGVEVQSSSLLSTLLRAPHSEYAGMVPDDTSSQHGAHHFAFMLQPYDGTWVEADVALAAQAFNSPMTVMLSSTEARPVPSFSLKAKHVLMSCMKFAQDASGDLIVRLYEVAGTAENAVFYLADAGAHGIAGSWSETKVRFRVSKDASAWRWSRLK